MNHNLSDRKSLSTFFEEETKEDYQSPSFHHLSQNFSPTHSTLDASSFRPQSPESLWSLSPNLSNNPSHPSLLYSCISSLRHDGDVYSIAVVSGDLVLTGSSSRRVHAWQSLDCHAKGYFEASSGEVRAMVAQGNLLFTTHKDHKIRIWNLITSTCNTNFKPKKVTTLPNSNHFKKLFISRPIFVSQHRDIISCIAYYHVEGILYTGSFDKTVKTWRLSEKKCIDSFIAHSDNINDMVINQQNGYLFTCSSDGTVKMWLRIYGETSHALIKVISHHTHPIYALALSIGSPSQNQNSYLYSGSFDGSISFWEQDISCQCNQGNRVIQGHQFAVLCLVTLENLVISGSEDSTIRIWRREERRGSCHECLAVLEGHTGPVRCLAALLKKGEFEMSFLVYSASLDKTFKVWKVKLLKEMKNSLVDYSNGDDGMEDKKCMEYESSPVLSPSWVKRKLHCRSIH